MKLEVGHVVQEREQISKLIPEKKQDLYLEAVQFELDDFIDVIISSHFNK